MRCAMRALSMEDSPTRIFSEMRVIIDTAEFRLCLLPIGSHFLFRKTRAVGATSSWSV